MSAEEKPYEIGEAVAYRLAVAEPYRKEDPHPPTIFVEAPAVVEALLPGGAVRIRFTDEAPPGRAVEPLDVTFGDPWLSRRAI